MLYYFFCINFTLFYDVILVSSVRSIVLRVRNKGDDDTEATGMYTGYYAAPQIRHKAEGRSQYFVSFSDETIDKP